ncbi:MAG TPA: hypothetical protein VF228_13410 [Iamia sp.]
MKSGRARRNRAWFVSGIVATAVVVGGAGPAPGQVPDLDGPEVVYVDAFGPSIYAYEDCDGVLHTEEDPLGFVFLELDYEVEADVAVGITFTGSLADDLVDPPTAVDVAAGEAWGEVEFELDELETGDLTVTVEPGVGYTTSADDTYTMEITDEVEIVVSCKEDLGTPPNDTDRQTIDVGERPDPIGFFEDEEEDSGDSSGFAQLQAAVRAAPAGYSTPVANGSLPPGLTYEDDVWAGAATTPGLYSFDIRVCLDQSTFRVDAGREGGARRPTPRAFPNVICFGYVDVQVLVEAVTPPPPAAAPAAQPVTAPARFAG